MKSLQFKKQFATVVLAIISFSACKKNEVLVTADSKTAEDSTAAARPKVTAVGAANTLYISPLGNDGSGTGAATNPWKTLLKATTSVSAAGSIIHVNAGTYVEAAQCSLKPGVSIEGEGITSVIKSAVTANFTAMIFLSSATEGTNGNQHISNLKFDGQNLGTAWGISVVGRSNVSIHDCVVLNFREVGVNFSGIASQNGYLPPTTYASGNIL